MLALFLFFALAAFSAALLGVRATDTFLPTLFGPGKIKDDAADDGNENCRNDNIFHNALFCMYYAFVFGLLRMLKSAITVAKITSAINPPMAALTFKDAGAVIHVPIVYTR